MFSIEYATSNFIPANRNEIVYRLEGFSDEWNHTDRKQTLITYTNLNPGKYTLVIKSDGDGIEEARLLIVYYRLGMNMVGLSDLHHLYRQSVMVSHSELQFPHQTA